MSKRIVTLVAVLAVVLASSFTFSGDSVACDGKKTETAKASAEKSSCTSSAAKTASAKSSCSKSASAKTASAKGSCSKSASAAKVAGVSGCDKGAKAAYASSGRACCANKSAASIAAKKQDAAIKAALLEITDEIPYLEPKRLVLAGSMECGKCSYKAVAKCAPLFKTVDGKVYPLVNNNLVTKMRKAKADEYEVSTNVRHYDGVKYLEVKAFKTL